MVLKRHHLLVGITFVLRTRKNEEFVDDHGGRIGAKVSVKDVVPGDIVTWSRSTQYGHDQGVAYVPDQIDLQGIHWVDRHKAYAIGLVVAVLGEPSPVCYIVWSSTHHGRR